jgi:hypothetical protein
LFKEALDSLNELEFIIEDKSSASGGGGGSSILTIGL